MGNKKLPKVLNKRTDDIPDDAVYVGRPTKWGNPFVVHADDSNRKEVIVKYKQYIIRRSALMKSLKELRGKDLVCWCSPKPCHADVLIKLANKRRRLRDGN